MLPTLLITLIFAYFIYAIQKLDLHRSALEALCKPVGEWFGEAGNPVRAALWVGALVVASITWLSPQNSFLGEMRGEITGMAVTVIVIDELVGYRNRIEKKQEIIEQMSSRSNDATLEAVRLTIKYGWLEDGSLRGANLGGADLHNALMPLADFQSAYLIGTNLQNVSLYGAKLQGTFFNGANLFGAFMPKANLTGAYLWNANLQDTNLKGANLEGAKLGGATYNDKTIFPDGFDPVAAGAIKVD